MPVENTEEARKLIQEWMTERGMFDSDKIAEDNAVFQLNGTTKTGITISILQLKALKDSVVVVSQLDIDPFHMKFLEKLSKSEKDDFLWELKKGLIFVPPNFSFRPSEIPEIPESVQFSTEIYFDELTKGKIRESVEQINRCVLWVAWLLGRRFGIPTTRVENE